MSKKDHSDVQCKTKRTPEENVAAGFPLADEFYAFTLPDGRVLNSDGEWVWPNGGLAAVGREIEDCTLPN
mgnify:CR=1 FL=1